MAVVIEAREAAGKSQREVSASMKRPVNFAHLVESGERMLSAIELPDYAKALDLEPAELFNRMLELERSGRPIPPRADGRKKTRKA